MPIALQKVFNKPVRAVAIGYLSLNGAPRKLHPCAES